MLSNIQNVMTSKRANTSNSRARARLMDLRNGLKYDIVISEDDDEFVIGRSLNSSILIEELYISRLHCVITYENNQFTLMDNNSCSGTFINCEKLTSNTGYILKEGDVIGFGDKKKLEFMFKFVLVSNSDKKLKLDNDNCKKQNKTKMITLKNKSKTDEKLKNYLFNLQTKLNDLRVEKVLLNNRVKTQFAEFENFLNVAVKDISELNAQFLVQKDIINELSEKNELCMETLKINEEFMIDIKNFELLPDFKQKIFDLTENDFQCPICNEVMVKVTSANCSHSFCETCIKTWLSKNQNCPVCRSPVLTTVRCLTLDNYITNICNVIGGTAKEQRNNLLRERAPISAGTAKRGRGKKTVNRRRAQPRVPPTYDIDFNGFPPILLPPVYPANFAPSSNIEVVDLTNSISH